MDDRKAIRGALAMDLKRIALGLYRGSYATANRFKEEALIRSSELEKLQNSAYIEKLISGMKVSLTGNDQEAAEDALMYSTLFQNFALKN